jgi:hypothetical protein
VASSVVEAGAEQPAERRAVPTSRFGSSARARGATIVKSRARSARSTRSRPGLRAQPEAARRRALR